MWGAPLSFPLWITAHPSVVLDTHSPQTSGSQTQQWGFSFRTPALSYTIQFLVISKSQGCAGSSLLSPSILVAVVSLGFPEAFSFSLLLCSLPSVAWSLCKAKFMMLAAAAQYLLPIDPRCCRSFVLCPSFSCLMAQLLLSSPGFQGNHSSEGDTPDSP